MDTSTTSGGMGAWVRVCPASAKSVGSSTSVRSACPPERLITWRRALVSTSRSSRRVRISVLHMVMSTPSFFSDSVFFGLFTRAAARGTSNCFFASWQAIRFASSCPVTATSAAAPRQPAASSTWGEVPSPQITGSSSWLARRAQRPSSRSINTGIWPRSSSARARWKPTLPPPTMHTRGPSGFLRWGFGGRAGAGASAAGSRRAFGSVFARRASAVSSVEHTSSSPKRSPYTWLRAGSSTRAMAWGTPNSSLAIWATIRFTSSCPVTANTAPQLSTPA